MKLFIGAALWMLLLCPIQAQTLWSEGFENWETITGGSLEQPEGWFSSNVFHTIFDEPPSLQSNTDAYQGNLSAELMVSPDLGFGPTGGLMNTKAGISDKPYFLTGWYKFNSEGDSVLLRGSVFWHDTANDTDIVIGVADTLFTQFTGSYTFFSIPFDYSSNETPDTFRIIFAYQDDNLLESSSLLIDELKLEVALSTGHMHALNSLAVYPNPAVNLLHVFLPKAQGSLQLINNLGQTVYAQTQISGNQTFHLPLDRFSAGMYWLSWQANDGSIYGQKVFIQPH